MLSFIKPQIYCFLPTDEIVMNLIKKKWFLDVVYCVMKKPMQRIAFGCFGINCNTGNGFYISSISAIIFSRYSFRMFALEMIPTYFEPSSTTIL